MTRAAAVGLLVGFLIAASPGPMFFLVVRRTLARGRRSGLISGLGIATGDAIYAALAAFGVAAVTSVLVGQRRWIGLIGGVALVVIGLRTIIGRQPAHSERPLEGGRGNVAGAYASMVALTLSNPPTILSFAAVFAGLGPRGGSGWQSSAALVLGVTLGSALWWVVLTGIASSARARLTPQVARAIALVSGLALVGFGALIGLQSVFSS
jgi:threonine/homoserine/homoserine lactone efflux protein